MNRNSRGMRRPTSGSGPLIMTHQIKNIDLELELLKRKREMIEQQQMLMMDEDKASSRQFDFDSMVYEDREPCGSNSPFGRKREADPHWYNESFRKRGPKKTKGNQSNFNKQSYSPYASSRAQRPGSSSREDYSAVPPLMDIQTNKPKRPIKQGKRYSPPRPERSGTTPVATKTVYGGVQDMLLPNKTPSLQVNGRLELALGMVLKDIREVHGNQPPHMLRLIKESIRERVRAVMLGKVVGNLMEIMKIYREEFPPETDTDIINIAQAANKRIQLKHMKPAPGQDAECAAQTGEPTKISFGQSVETDLKNNFIKLIETQLKEMLVEMEDYYHKKKHEENQEASNTVPDGSEASETPAVASVPLLGSYQKDRSISDNFCKLYKIIDPPDMREIMPRLIKKHLPLISNLLFLNDKFTYEREMLVSEVKDLLKSVTKKEPRRLAQPYIKAPFFVKVMGCPVLPKKWAMQVFLDQFSPSVVKKHKSIHNLLFVGLTEKQDYDAILAANGSRIGNIVISTKSNQKPEANENDNRDEDQDNTDPIDSELDSQINDLLNSIRNSEETTNKSDADKDNGSSKDEEVFIIEDEAADVIDLNEDEDQVTNNDNTTLDTLETNTEKPELNEVTENINSGNDITEIADSPVETSSEITNDADGNSEPMNDKVETGTTELIETNDNSEPNNHGNDVGGTPYDTDNSKSKNNESANDQSKNDEEIVNTDNKSVEKGKTADKVQEMNTKVGTRSSARLASAPSRVLTRRSSKLLQNE